MWIAESRPIGTATTIAMPVIRSVPANSGTAPNAPELATWSVRSAIPGLRRARRERQRGQQRRRGRDPERGHRDARQRTPERAVPAVVGGQRMEPRPALGHRERAPARERERARAEGGDRGEQDEHAG